MALRAVAAVRTMTVENLRVELLACTSGVTCKGTTRGATCIWLDSSFMTNTLNRASCIGGFTLDLLNMIHISAFSKINTLTIILFRISRF